MPRPNSRRRGYSWQWEQATAAYKRTHPLCLGCQAIGVLEAATCVDHVIPHKGDETLFWDYLGNWQPACDWHHNAVKKKLEHLWFCGLVKAHDLRLDSKKSVEISRQLVRPSKKIYDDGWPA